MENRLSSTDASFDSPISSDSDEEVMSPSQFLEDKRFSPEDLVANSEAEDMNHAALFEASNNAA